MVMLARGPRAAPTPTRGHIGSGLGLLDKSQRLIFDAILIACLLRAPALHLGSIAFNRLWLVTAYSSPSKPAGLVDQRHPTMERADRKHGCLGSRTPIARRDHPSIYDACPRSITSRASLGNHAQWASIRRIEVVQSRLEQDGCVIHERVRVAGRRLTWLRSYRGCYEYCPLHACRPACRLLHFPLNSRVRDPRD